MTTLKELANSSIDEELAALEKQKAKLLASKEQLNSMTDKQIEAVVSITSLYQKLTYAQRRAMPGGPGTRRPLP